MTVNQLLSEGYRVVPVEQGENSTLLSDFKTAPSDKIALVFGNEVKGVDQAVIDLCQETIEIPQFGTKHSLNISVSLGIVVWEVCKQLNS